MGISSSLSAMTFKSLMTPVGRAVVACYPRYLDGANLVYAVFTSIFSLVESIRVSNKLFPSLPFVLLGIAATWCIVIRWRQVRALGIAVGLPLMGAIATLGLVTLKWTEPLLEYQWRSTFKHNPNALIAVEQAHQCCGFRTVNDQPMPKNKSQQRKGEHDEPCRTNAMLGYSDPCLPKLAEMLTSNYTGLVIITVVFGLLQAACLLVYMRVQTRAPLYLRASSASDGHSEPLLGRRAARSDEAQRSAITHAV
ncbi:hypothetical protein H4R35_004590 [Dimargaris xerosporica]|nr:hypothetical protein H4R35_004590 [Dimargaris xerosporica]